MLSDHKDNKPPDSSRGRWSWAFLRRAGKWSRNRFLIGAPGNPMMERWRLLQTPLFGVYLHRIYREDLDPVPHDHPWRFGSLVLRGGYEEIYYPDIRELTVAVQKRHDPWSLHKFPLCAAHQIVSVQPRTLTLVLVGRKLRTWGFYDYRRGNAFVDWRDALNLRPTEGARSTGKYRHSG